MRWLEADEVELALSFWGKEKDESLRAFMASLTEEQRELLRRYRQAKRKLGTLRRWLAEVREGGILKRKIPVPEWARKDFAYVRVAKEAGLPANSYEEVREAIKELSLLERRVLEVVFGLNGEKPLSSRRATFKLGLPPGYILRVKKMALEKIAKSVRSENSESKFGENSEHTDF
jgi:hypothetical protein